MTRINDTLVVQMIDVSVEPPIVFADDSTGGETVVTLPEAARVTEALIYFLGCAGYAIEVRSLTPDG